MHEINFGIQQTANNEHNFWYTAYRNRMEKMQLFLRKHLVEAKIIYSLSTNSTQLEKYFHKQILAERKNMHWRIMPHFFCTHTHLFLVEIK